MGLEPEPTYSLCYYCLAVLLQFTLVQDPARFCPRCGAGEQ